jgi:opacity protein-like surface antigen
MVAVRLKISAMAAIASLAACAAYAADYSQPLPPQQPMYVQPPPVQEFTDGWYLRGQVGVGMLGFNLQYQQNPANFSDFAFEHSSIANQYFIGGGVGYEWNNWLRFDVTAEYRAKARVYAFGSYTDGGATRLDTYEGNMKSWVFLANAYVDLGTWNCFTPFVGAGIGTAYTTLADFTDINPSLAGRGFGRNPSEWHLAWALHAGVAYEVTKNFKIELAYRYLNFGSVTDTVDCVGGCAADSYKLGSLYSHDIMLGLRWTCCETPAPPPRYVYTPPPPVYAPPPLRSRG